MISIVVPLQRAWGYRDSGGTSYAGSGTNLTIVTNSRCRLMAR